MLEFLSYGGNPDPIPESFDTNTILEIVKQAPIAWGRWTKSGFILKMGSLIFRRENEELNYPKEIRKMLLEANLLIDIDEHSSTLNQDILLPSPSGAAVMVLGQNSNGKKEWRNSNGIMLGHLLEPANPDYH